MLSSHFSPLEISSQNTAYTFEELVQLDINELNLLTESGSTRLESVESVGTASDKDYIGAEAARTIAITHAGVNEAEITKYESELDFEKGVMVYDIEFDCDGYEYDYDINAKTGEIVKYEKERAEVYTAPSQAPDASSSGIITEADAKAIALAHAGLSEGEVKKLKCETDKDDGVLVYEVEFKVGNVEYEYEIAAKDGSVIKYDVEKDD